MNTKKGFLFKLLLFIIVVILLFLLIKMAIAASVVYSINVTLKANSSDIIVNVTDTIFSFNNTPAVISMQVNRTINFGNDSLIQFLNASNITVVCPTEIELTNATKQEFFNHYVTQLSGKIEESSNKVAQDVLFKLEPTKAQLDECKQMAFNSSLKEQEAFRQRDKVVADNLAITSVLDNERSERRTLQVVGLSFVVMVVLSAAFYLGFLERKGRLW